MLSAIRNLLLYHQSTEIENHVIYTIDADKNNEYSVPGLQGAASERVFYYSSRWNFYYTCKQLAKLLPGENAVIVAHDWMELGMVSNLGLQNPVVQILHGNYDYYLDLAVKHSRWINAFIVVAADIKTKLLGMLPQRSADIYYNKMPVPEVKGKQGHSLLSKIVFVGRCEERKGYFVLPKIAKLLAETRNYFEWHVIGEGSLEKDNQELWTSGVNVQFYGVLTNKEILAMLPSFDYLILPSLAEGMPLTVVEAMKAGLIPVVNELSGGMQEIVCNGITGFRVTNNAPDRYAEIFTILKQDHLLANNISENAKEIANRQFNPYKNTSFIENVMIKATQQVNQKPPRKIYGSRLDQLWIPNLITEFLRKS